MIKVSKVIIKTGSAHGLCTVFARTKNLRSSKANDRYDSWKRNRRRSLDVTKLSHGILSKFKVYMGSSEA